VHVEESEEEKLHNEKSSMKIESTEASMSLSVRTERERRKEKNVRMKTNSGTTQA
jgi:hypothetical protein